MFNETVDPIEGTNPKWSSPLDAAIALRDEETMDMVKQAVGAQRVVLAYQPVVRTRGDGSPAFYEACVRLLDPTGRVIPAGDFIGAIEGHEIGRRIDTMALSLGLRGLQETPNLRLSVNMSARSIGYRKWLKTLEAGLASDPTIGERLILEITESSAMIMPDVTHAFMQEISAHGISFALDDFGSGYTSFRYLRHFCFDIIKIDGQFTRGIHRNTDDQVLCDALIAIARHFEMYTVAEAVETEEDADYLASIGIDCMQGYYYGAPTLRPAFAERDRKRRSA